MSNNIEGYCRLCAESQLETGMLSLIIDNPDNSKVITKLSWINIGIYGRNGLPNTICYLCLDLLESTWRFLNTVRSAQVKLEAMCFSVSKETVSEIEVKNNHCDYRIPGKPVDENWESFQNLKREAKIENFNNNLPITFNEDPNKVKLEDYSDGDDIDHFSTDSDVPLKQTIKKRNAVQKNAVVNSSENQIEVKTEPNSDNENFPCLSKYSNIMQVVTKKKKSLKKLKKTNQICTLNITWNKLACKCATCDKEYPNILQLQKHSLEIHSFCCVFKCIHCSKVIHRYVSFVVHAKTHNKSLNRCCEFCNTSFRYETGLKAHKKEHHKNVMDTKCRICGMGFKAPEKLKEHGKMYNKSPRERMLHKCDQCNKTFNFPDLLKRHKKATHSNRTRDYACHICGMAFYTKSVLIGHTAVHKDKRFKCDLCPYASYTKGQIVTHIRFKHSELRSYICEKCGKSFKSKSNLEVHYITHTDLKPFQCKLCSRSFRCRKYRNKHVRLQMCLSPSYHPKSKRETKVKL